jgi:sugar transferase (PEP-CTERM/EpsH1 system associated)
MAPYARSVNNIPKILDFVDSDASKWQQYAELKPAPSKWLYGREARSLKQYEADMVRDFDFSVFVSKREAEYLHEAVNGTKVHVIQNGVDFEYFSTVCRNGSPRGIVFTGAMDYYPNVDAVTFFAREILPAVRSAVPDARFLIVGSNPSPQVRLLAKLHGVMVSGTVKDVRPFLADAGVAVVPTRISQGIQNKILEALASGLPVVATRAALGGMSYTHDLPVVEADNAGTFAERVIEFLKNPLSPAQTEACRRSLRLAYDWDVNLSAFDRLFERLAPAHCPA